MPKGTPAYVTLNADGTVGADFSGHISAAGVDIIAAVDYATAPAERKITWHKDTITGASVARVSGVSNDGSNLNQIGMGASSNNGTSGLASVFADVAQDGTFADVGVSAYKATTGLQQFRTLVDETGKSNLLQVGNVANFGSASPKRSMTGTGTLTWNGAAVSTILGVTHSWNTLAVRGVVGFSLKAGDNYSAVSYFVNFEQFGANLNTVVIRITSSGGAPPVGQTTVGYILWEE